MKVVTARIQGSSPLSQSKHIDPEKYPKLDGENSRDYEKRTWRNRMHTTEPEAKGKVFIPPMAFKNSMTEAAKFLGLQIPGKGKATYTKHFEAGILVVDPMVLNVDAETVVAEELFVPSDGIRGSGKRVTKFFPVIQPDDWGGELRILVFDETVLNQHGNSGMTVLQHVLIQSGKFVGIGRFRPKNNGFYGRFDVKDFKIAEEA